MVVQCVLQRTNDCGIFHSHLIPRLSFRGAICRHHCKLLLVCILRIIMHFSPCPVSQAEQPSRRLGMAAPPLHAMELEQQKLLSKGNRLCVILHPNDKSKLESNLFLKTSFLYYLL